MAAADTPNDAEPDTAAVLEQALIDLADQQQRFPDGPTPDQLVSVLRALARD
jgi:hypothetical protein